MGWLGGFSLRDMNLVGCLESGGFEEFGGIGVGEKDWIFDVNVKSKDLIEVGKGGGYS